jgi:hypothetical protein
MQLGHFLAARPPGASLVGTKLDTYMRSVAPPDSAMMLAPTNKPQLEAAVEDLADIDM